MGYGSSNAPGATYPELVAVREQANNANSKAAAAQAQAADAQETAAAAMEKANSAEQAAGAAATAAAAAQEDADAALDAVAGAQETAQQAQETANTAKQTADQAATAAAQAQATADAVSQALTDLNSTINAVPSQNGAMTYNGSEQSPVWNGYDPEKLTIGGTTSGTNAGEYSATFTPKEGFKWADDTTDAKTVTWVIGRASLTAPAQSGTLTYNGAAQSPEWSGYDSTKMTIGGTTSGTNAGSYGATFTPGANYQWSDGATTAKTVTWSIGKAAGSLSLSKTTLSITSKTAQVITATKAGDGAITATSSDTSVATVAVSGSNITITPKKDGTTNIVVSVAASTNHTAPSSKACAVTVSLPKIYGVQWDGSSTTAWTRTDDAALFTDPVPYVKGATAYGSPFDNLQPWAGMERVTDSVAGELVKIPKFWFKWTKSGNTLKLQISDKAQTGFFVSPAHADRGDGKGERDVVYVGRYHSCSTYKSTTGQAPKASITRSSARSGIAALGTGIYQFDMAMRVTIQMLYLVEFADWDSQKKIGYGCGNGNGTQNVGASDTMPYHTGTMQSSRTTYGVGVQYRYIEGLWENVYDWLDGCYYNSNGLNIVKNPANFSDSANGTAVGTPSSGYPTVMSVATISGLEWVIYPTTANGSNTTYVPDYWNFSASNPCLRAGGYYGQSQSHGLFFVGCNAASSASAYVGCRLQKLP